MEKYRPKNICIYAQKSSSIQIFRHRKQIKKKKFPLQKINQETICNEIASQPVLNFFLLSTLVLVIFLRRCPICEFTSVTKVKNSHKIFFLGTDSLICGKGKIILKGKGISKRKGEGLNWREGNEFNEFVQL